MNMDNLTAIQISQGKEIEKILNAFYNDKPERKTLTYLTEKLELLEVLWTDFEKRDDEIRKRFPEAIAHSYFTSDYYNKVKSEFEKTKSEIEYLINHLSVARGAVPKNTPAKIQTIESQKQATPVNQKTHENDTKNHDDALIKLIRRQRMAMQTIEHILSSIEYNNQTRQYYELKITLIKRYWKQIEENNIYIREMVEDDAAISYKFNNYLELEDRIQNTLIRLNEEFENFQGGSQNTSVVSTTLSHMKLPKIVLPKFDGSYLKWQQFYDLFNQMVHNQPLSNVQKMCYLKTNLTGEAEKLIRHLAPTEDNYNTAWNMLKERYGNKRLLVTALLDKLMAQPVIQHESAATLKSLHDTTRECLSSLQNLGLSVKEYWDPIIVHIIMKKLDKNSHALYEQLLSDPKELQAINNLLNFLEKRFQALEALGKGRFLQSSEKSQSRTSRPNVLIANKTSSLECIMCNKNHAIYYCDKFLKLSPNERHSKAIEANLCLNCLKKGHNCNKCSSRGCLKCNKRHNTLLHAIERNKTIFEKEPSTKNVQLSTSVSLAAHSTEYRNGYVFLGTALANTRDIDGQVVPCRVLLDSGSQLNFITEKLKRKLRLENTHVNLNISGIGDSKIKLNERMQIIIESKLNNYSTQLEVFVIKEIAAHQPQQFINIDNWEIPTNISLADPDFNKPQRVDILLGAEVYGELMRIGQYKLSNKLPMLQNTTLGWIVLGKVSTEEYIKPFCGITNLELESQLQRFWELEEYPVKPILSINDQKCEQFFDSTTTRNQEGRFVVNLPMLSDPRLIGESRDMAFKRLMSIERRLSKDASLRTQYCAFLDEYIKLGHMRELTSKELKQPYCFLPHHFVLKPSSSSTKLRVVFDASAKTSNNLSLNDLLLNGPKIQDDLISIILRFRTKKYVFTADIVKMYRQILVAEEDQNLQLIMWRQDPSGPVKYYKLCTVTYGTKSAPYLAVKCLQRLAEDEKHHYPLGASAIRDFYVDDVMTGSDCLDEAVDIQGQLRALLNQAGFQLRKWCANHPKLVENIPKEDLEIQLSFSNLENDHVKTLGLLWHPVTDYFSITASARKFKNVTKRTILAETSQLFDPLGLINPVVVATKILIQELWKLKLGWDDELPERLHSKWLQFRQDLTKLNDFKIPRYVCSADTSRSIELHAFADASERAYGTALYVRSQDVKGKVFVKLLCAKSRVAPVKPTTLPRLELCAAKLAVNLVNQVKKVIDLSFDEITYWSDSQIVISWIRRDPSQLKTFVANRIGIIQELSQKNQWRYVNTKENPADLISRGALPDQLIKSTIWFEGPDFLKQPKSTWPRIPYEDIRVEEEEKTTRIALTVTNSFKSEHPIYCIDHGNSFRKLQRVMAYVIRAIKLFRNKGLHKTFSKYLSVKELEDAEVAMIKEIQQSSFTEDLRDLNAHKQIKKSSKLATLSPFVDEQGLMRVGGRLEAADMSYHTKHPLLLPSDSFITKLLMNYYHVIHLHAGPQALHAIVRQKYWILQARNIARSVVTNCVICTRLRPRLCQQQMGNLPKHRVQPARPFINCGVDFCGPVYTHFKIRGKRPQKSYIAVFCCFATKAVHLEVVSDLTTEGFLGALKRFVARRGMCENIYCDNAKNFVGAKNQLQEIGEILMKDQSQEQIINMCSEKKIQFHFIPPRSPHFGGLWEAAVKSTKYLLQRTLLTMSPTYEELCTVIAEVEAILNSRPLTQLSSDPNDLAALTPAHFLIGEPMTNTVESHTETKLSLLSRWALVSHIKNEFWKRWSQEYLLELQKRAKWIKQYPDIKPGTLVLIKEDNLPPLKWTLGRVDEVIRGNDGKVRVVDVKTATGIFRRAVHQLAPLPVDLEETDSEQLVIDHQNSEDESASEDDNRRKGRKRKAPSAGNALKVLLLTMLILPIYAKQPTDSHSSIYVEEFNHNAGSYFENLGRVSMAPDTWSLLVYFNLKGYWATIHTIERSLEHLQKLSRAIVHNDYYKEILNQYHHQLVEIKNRNSLLEDKRPHLRKRRAPLDIIGSIANKLFGILDSDYAEQMTETTTKVKTNENHLNELFRNQTSILEATVNIIRKDEEVRNNQTETIEKSLNAVYENTRNMNSEMKQQKIIQSFNSLAILVMSLINECKFMQESILEVITDTHHGRANPLVISPMQLQSQISLIKNSLPVGTSIPSINGRIDISLIYKLINIHCKILNNYVLFGIQLPLISTTNFNLYKIISLPTLINQSFISVSPTHQYLITNIYRDQFYLLTQYEFMHCTEIQKQYFICEQNKPVIHNGINNNICEIQLFVRNTFPSTCKINIAKPSKIWIPLHTTNHWLFSLDKEYDFSFFCNNNLTHKILRKSGLLIMTGDCTMKGNELTIKTRNDLITKTTSNSFQPQLNLTENTIEDISMPVATYAKFAKHKMQLENITTELKHLKLHQTKLEDIRSPSIRHQAISYTTFAIMGIIIMYLVITYIRSRPKTVAINSPEPAPRKINRKTSTDYNFEVKRLQGGAEC